jgi:hypothetical protein
MATTSTLRLSRIVALTAVMTGIAAPQAWSEEAAATAGAPFAEAYRVADAELGQLRGGFESFDSGVRVPFGVDVSFQSFKDGHRISWFDVTNHDKGTVHVTSDNINFGPINHTTGPLDTNVSTSVTSAGIITMIQNTRPNITLQTLQSLKIDISGLQGLLRNSAHTSGRPLSIFH